MLLLKASCEVAQESHQHLDQVEAVYCTIPYCTVLYCIVLYCTVLYRRARMADLDGFSALFDKFVTQPGSSVDWDKIEKLPANSVRTKNICSIIEKYYLLFTDSAAR